MRSVWTRQAAHDSTSSDACIARSVDVFVLSLHRCGRVIRGMGCGAAHACVCVCVATWLKKTKTSTRALAFFIITLVISTII